nr:hypothetical protein [Aquicella lusitana]
MIMIGGESCEYGKTSVHGHDHNFKGHASDISNAGGLKWADKAFQRQLEQVDIKTPQKLGGIRIVADSNVETVMERYQYLGPVVKLGWPAEAKQMRQEVSKQAQTLSSTANNLSKFAELKHGVNAGLKQIKTMVKKATTIRERAMGKRLAELKDKEDDLLRTKNALADRLAEGKLPQSHEMEAFRQKLNAFSKEIKAFKKQYESLLIKSNSYAKYNAMDTTVLVVQNFIADCYKKMSAPNNEPSAELPSKKAAV